ncbi:internalin, putative, partial [hydrothermal vent metagenome]
MMRNTWFPQRGASRRLLNLVLATLLAAATLVFVQGTPALAVDVPSVTNPAWPDKCGVDIVMVFDASNSIKTGDADLMKQAGTEFVDALVGSPSNIAVTWFRGIDAVGGDGVGGTQIPLTSVTSSGAAVNTAINSIGFPGIGLDGGTNWEHGFNTTDPFPSADIVLFMTDGNPTTFNGSLDRGVPPPDPEDVDKGVTEANDTKSRGTRILAVGIGQDISVDNLKRISGPTQGDDWYLADDFQDLINTLPDIALQLCNGSVTVEKIVDGSPASGWEFTATPDSASPSATQVTGPDGTATFQWLIVSQDAPVDVTVTETLQDGFTFIDYSCTNEQTGQTLTAGFSLAQGENVTCTFNNITTPDPQIAIEKTTNGADADTPTGPQILVGDPVTWTYTVTNPGNVALSNVAVTDDQGVTPAYQGGDANDNGLLDPGETWTYAASGTATAGQYANTGTATADFEESPITNTDPSHYFGVDVSIDIEKATNGEDADAPTGPEVLVGDPVTWTYVVTNTGNVALSNVTVTDDQGVIPVYKSGDANENDILETTETWIYEATGTAVLGEYKNTGTVDADYEEEPATDSDLSHYVGVLPAVGDPLVIDKLVDNLDGTWVDVATYPSDQTTVTWQITLANTAEGDVFKVTLTDAVAPSCEPALDAALTAKGWTNTDGGYLPGGESVTFEC